MNYNLYIYKTGNNLGDIVGYYILKKYFPDIKFDATSNDYLFFGGSTFHHHAALGRMNSIVYFGNGLSSFHELDLPKCNNIRIYPRGKTTKDMLEAYGYKCDVVVGDIIQFLSLEPVIEEIPEQSELWIKDAFSEIPVPSGLPCIAICESPFTVGCEIVSDLDQFRNKIKSYNKIVSSQIHPFLIALMLGKPARLIAKDFRALDICNYFKIPFDCTIEDVVRVRKQALDNIPLMKETLLKAIT